MGRIFLSTSFFNIDIGSWDILKISSMGSMLYDASSFNLDLCAWGDVFLCSQADYIFLSLGCTLLDTHMMDQRGPLCVTSCIVPKHTSHPNLEYLVSYDSFAVGYIS